ncbi:Fpg/Nei family DNA glycosylase [Candidatus Dependentiae bacterium]|nr:Fpg/Nei family DNA glycosylase [Candidatus Dependentiae bacterium]
MPELPEVEAFCNYVKNTSLDKKIIKLNCKSKPLLKKPSFPLFQKQLIGQTFKKATRRGKYLIIDSNDQQLIIHFGLTGSLVFCKNDQESVPFSQLVIFFNDHSALHITDKRKFAKIWLTESFHEIKSIEELGQDALNIPEQNFIALFQQNHRQNIKAFLMDQKKIAGIGNEYSDEILFQSEIDPHHKVAEISLQKVKKIYLKMNVIFKYAIKLCSNNLKNLKKIDDGFASNYLQAHRHTDQKCPNNESHILKKITIASRSSYYCPIDQK